MIAGKAKSVILILNPMREIIQAVIVVPIFAPIITPIAWTNVSKAAFTKPTTNTVVAEED
jgi:hypothetical protein